MIKVEGRLKSKIRVALSNRARPLTDKQLTSFSAFVLRSKCAFVLIISSSKSCCRTHRGCRFPEQSFQSKIYRTYMKVCLVFIPLNFIYKLNFARYFDYVDGSVNSLRLDSGLDAPPRC